MLRVCADRRIATSSSIVGRENQSTGVLQPAFVVANEGIVPSPFSSSAHVCSSFDSAQGIPVCEIIRFHSMTYEFGYSNDGSMKLPFHAMLTTELYASS